MNTTALCATGMRDSRGGHVGQAAGSISVLALKLKRLLNSFHDVKRRRAGAIMWLPLESDVRRVFGKKLNSKFE